MNTKPGVMIYFEVLPVLKRLSNEEKGILFQAIMEYGANRTIPELPDNLYIFWPIIQSRLDTDDDRYHKVSLKRRYAIYVRWAKQHCQDPLPYDDWLCTLDDCDYDAAAGPLS